MPLRATHQTSSIADLRKLIAAAAGSDIGRLTGLPFGIVEVDGALPAGGLALGRQTSLKTHEK